MEQATRGVELLRSSATGDAVAVRRLLRRKAHLSPPCLFAAASAGHVPVIDLLAAADPSLINLQLSNGCSPLYTAAANGHAGVVRSLLQRGALIDQQSASGSTSLFIASQGGAVEVVDALLAADANAAIADSTGATALYVACQNGQLDCVELLLSRCGPLSAVLNAPKATGATPLYIACQKGFVEIAARLLDAKASVDTCTSAGASPLLISALQGHAAAVELLLANGADTNLESADGTTALIAACSAHASPPEGAAPEAPLDAPPLHIPRLLLRAGAAVCEQGGIMTRSGLALASVAQRCNDHALLLLLEEACAPFCCSSGDDEADSASDSEGASAGGLSPLVHRLDLPQAVKDALVRLHRLPDSSGGGGAEDAQAATAADAPANTLASAGSMLPESLVAEAVAEAPPTTAPPAAATPAPDETDDESDGGEWSDIGEDDGEESDAADSSDNDDEEGEEEEEQEEQEEQEEEEEEEERRRGRRDERLSAAVREAASLLEAVAADEEATALTIAADAALRAAIVHRAGHDGADLENLRAEIEAHTRHASAAVLADARMLRDKLREKLRRAARQRRRMREAARAELARAHVRARAEAAEALHAALQLQELVHADGVDALRAALAASEASARVLHGHGAEAQVRTAQERLRRLEEEEADAARSREAAIGASAAEESEEEINEEGAAAAARAQQQQEAAVAAAVHAQAASARGAAGTPLCPPSPTPRVPSSTECSVCMDGVNSHVLVPCGHKCVCAGCAELVRTHGACPICRTAIVWVCEVFE